MVTGAAGALGTRVAARLLARPDVDRVVAIDLRPVAGAPAGVDPLVLDLSAAVPGDGRLEQAMEGADAVLHLAWRLADGGRPGLRREAAVADANRRALRSVLDAAAKAGVAKVVAVSSATVYGAWPDNSIPLTEEARIRPNPEFAYAVAKAESERLVAEWADSHPSVRVAVLRPAVTVGSGERPLYRALGVTRSPRLGDEGRPVQYLHVDDLAEAVVVAWAAGLAGVFNVAPDTGITEERARELAGGVARVPLPAGVAGRISAWGWRLWRRGVPPEARAYATYPWVVAPDRLKAHGWQPAHSSEEALVATDSRPHWDDLPPGRRQNYTLIGVVTGSVALAGGLVAGALAIRRRRRRSA